MALNTFHLSAANSTNGTLVRAGKTYLRGWTIATVGTFRALRIYDKATTPVVGTDIPIITIASNAAGQTTILPEPILLENGLGIGITSTGPADNDTGAVGLGDTAIQVYWGT